MAPQRTFQALLTTLQCDGDEYRRLSCHRRRPMGAVFKAQKMPRCEAEKGGSQRPSSATPEVRRLIRAMENQRHCCCGACPYVHLTLAPMNASRNILQRACSWPCKQSRVSSTFQRPLLWRGVALFPCLPCAVLVWRENTFHNRCHQAPTNKLEGFPASRKSIQSGSQRELSNACHLLQPRALQLPSAARCLFLPCRPKPHGTL
ncbi:hypothetical protein TcCL_NonESM07814 [Trypanosoma cruzi]|nr:hypothetical protein TcCL_NonESM07814 [Trypanosoma cruzi]